MCEKFCPTFMPIDLFRPNLSSYWLLIDFQYENHNDFQFNSMKKTKTGSNFIIFMTQFDGILK